MERELDWASEYLCWCVFVMTVCRWERGQTGRAPLAIRNYGVCVCECSGAGVLEASLAVAVIRHDCGILISSTFPFSIPLSLSLPFCPSSVWLHRSWSVCCPPSLIQLWSRWIEMHSDWLLLLNICKCYSSLSSLSLQDLTSSVFEMHTISTSISLWNLNLCTNKCKWCTLEQVACMAV